MLKQMKERVYFRGLKFRALAVHSLAALAKDTRRLVSNVEKSELIAKTPLQYHSGQTRAIGNRGQCEVAVL